MDMPTFTRRILISAALLALGACSGQPQSLADYIASLCAASFRSASPDEAPFLADSVAAMTKMMGDMGIRPSGDVDKDFVAMMVPHHQGAIEMALAELKFGRNERLRRMAQEIIVTQQQEIVAMRLAIGEPIDSVPPGRLSAATPSDSTSVK